MTVNEKDHCHLTKRDLISLTLESKNISQTLKHSYSPTPKY